MAWPVRTARLEKVLVFKTRTVFKLKTVLIKRLSEAWKMPVSPCVSPRLGSDCEWDTTPGVPFTKPSSSRARVTGQALRGQTSGHRLPPAAGSLPTPLLAGLLTHPGPSLQKWGAHWGVGQTSSPLPAQQASVLLGCSGVAFLSSSA